ncbi:MAG: YceD family protein [Cyanobacteria bacterium P01_F01_bin.3]
MRAIHIPQIVNAPNKTIALDVAEHLPQLETLTPVKGELSVAHRGTFLEVRAKASAIMTLECDRCLQSYNTRVQVDTSEILWLEEPVVDDPVLEKEVELEDLVESLPPQGYFRPGEWLYEQMCLAIPQRQICDTSCPGIEITSNPPETEVDHRWAALSQLKQQLADPLSPPSQGGG